MKRRNKELLWKVCVLSVCLVVLCGLLWGTVLYQSEAEFRDIGLEDAVRENLEKPHGLVTRTDLLQITHLDASHRNIQYLDGIENIRRLVELDLSDNNVRDLSPLKDLQKLTEINLQKNGIICLNQVGFKALEGLPLRKLVLRDNFFDSGYGQISWLADIESLAALSYLEELDLRNNHVSDPAPLKKLFKMRDLDLRDNKVTDIGFLEGMPNLQRLNLRENNVSDISPLSKLNHIEYLNIHSNRFITSLQPLSGLDKLHTLIMRDVPAGSQVKHLKGLASLMRLNLRNCNVTEIYFLVDLMASGALQDSSRGQADLDLRDNLIKWDAFLQTRNECRYWLNISKRLPPFIPPECTLEPPVFSRPGGFYSNPFKLSLDHSNPEAVIIYTLDGSEPDMDNLGGTTYMYKNEYPKNPGDPFGKEMFQSFRSLVYTDPIKVYDRSLEEDRLTGISTSIESNPDYFPSSPVRKGTVVRAVAYKPGRIPSKVMTHTYFVLPQGKTYGIPVISLAVQEDYLFDYHKGIYTAGVDFDDWRKDNPDGHYFPWVNQNSQRRGVEYPLNFEFFEPHKERVGLNQLAGFRIHGSTSRSLRLKNLRLYARSIYSESDVFNYNFFPGVRPFSSKSDNHNFQRLMLRSHGGGGPYNRDAVSNILIQQVYESAQRVRPAAVFINGEYWGITSVRDRFDQYHLANNYGLDPENIIITGEILGRGQVDDIKTGRPEDLILYREMYNFIVNNDMSDQALYERVHEMLDIRSFVDYLVMNIYLGKGDWKGYIHRGFWRARYSSDNLFGDGKWRAYTWDWDLSTVQDPDYNWLHMAVQGSDPAANLLSNLSRNEGFLQLLLKYFPEHMKKEFIPEDVKNLIIQEYEKVKPYFSEEIDLWSFDWIESGLNAFSMEGTAMFQSLLANDSFRYYFINRFADHLNTTFDPGHVKRVVQEEYSKIESYLRENFHRWNFDIAPESVNDDFIYYAHERPALQRKHIREEFRIDKEVEIILDVSNDLHGYIRINTIKIDSNTPGVRDQTYPWRGVYFSGVPIELEAVVYDGFRFLGWKIENMKTQEKCINDGCYNTDPVIKLKLGESTTAKAMFVQSSDLK